MARRATPNLTTPDLVVLSLLAEHAMHGYQLVQELERREVRDWAGISRPQVYYSLKKLQRAGLVKPISDDQEPVGPERRVFAPTPAARAALADSLEHSGWATQRPPPPFLTWLVLSIHARGRTVKTVVAQRRGFLSQQIAKERTTLEAIRLDQGPTVRIAEAIVGLTIRQFELELIWLGEIEEVLLAHASGGASKPKT